VVAEVIETVTVLSDKTVPIVPVHPLSLKVIVPEALAGIVTTSSRIPFGETSFGIPVDEPRAPFQVAYVPGKELCARHVPGAIFNASHLRVTGVPAAGGGAIVIEPELFTKSETNGAVPVELAIVTVTVSETGAPVRSVHVIVYVFVIIEAVVFAGRERD